MPQLFEYKDYRLFLLTLVKDRKDKGMPQAELAKAMGCQAAYFSQVLKANSDITEDQAVRLCTFLNFNGAETEYFLALVRLARAGTQELRTYLQKSIEQLSLNYAEVESRITSSLHKDANDKNVYYCSSWIPAIIHSGTSCKKYQTAADLSQRFDLEKKTVEFHLQSLEKYGLVKFESGKWSFLGGSLHFSKNSPLDQSFQINRRLHAINALSQRKNENIHYATVFSVDERTVKKIRPVLLEVIGKIHLMAEPAKSEDVHSMCLDFFRA